MDPRPQAGDRVRIHSLVSRADLNEAEATLVGFQDGRWNAVVLRDGKGVKLKPANIALHGVSLQLTRELSPKPPVAFSIVPFAGRGVGCMALRDVELGERLMSEAPLTVEGPGRPPIEESVAALSEHDRARFFELAQDVVLRDGTWTPVSEVTHARARDKSEDHASGAADASARAGDAELDKEIDGIVGTNGMPYTHRGDDYGGVFPTLARLNHSCDANAANKWNAALGEMTVHATRPIKAGSEITLCYSIDGRTYAPRAARQAHLQASFGFTCACSKCGLNGEALRLSEARIATLGDDAVLFARLYERCAPASLLREDAGATLTHLERRYALMRDEYPGGVHHGTDSILLCFVEFCEHAHTALLEHAAAAREERAACGEDAAHGGADDGEPPSIAALSTKARTYAEGYRRWLAEKRGVHRTLAGEDAPAYTVCSEALALLDTAPLDLTRPGALGFTARWAAAGLAPSPVARTLQQGRWRVGSSNNEGVVDAPEIT